MTKVMVQNDPHPMIHYSPGLKLIEPARKALMDVQGCEMVIANPCKMDWDKMHGDAKKRFCHECSLFVYDMQALDGAEQLNLVNMVKQNKKVCARLYVRTDGKVMAQNCPLGRRVQMMYDGMKAAALLLITATLAYGLVRGVSWAGNEIRISLDRTAQELSQLTLGNMASVEDMEKAQRLQQR